MIDICKIETILDLIAEIELISEIIRKKRIGNDFGIVAYDDPLCIEQAEFVKEIERLLGFKFGCSDYGTTEYCMDITGLKKLLKAITTE